jgi:hypothetical protein
MSDGEIGHMAFVVKNMARTDTDLHTVPSINPFKNVGSLCPSGPEVFTGMTVHIVHGKSPHNAFEIERINREARNNNILTI